MSEESNETMRARREMVDRFSEQFIRKHVYMPEGVTIDTSFAVEAADWIAQNCRSEAERLACVLFAMVAVRR